MCIFVVPIFPYSDHCVHKDPPTHAHMCNPSVTDEDKYLQKLNSVITDERLHSSVSSQDAAASFCVPLYFSHVFSPFSSVQTPRLQTSRYGQQVLIPNNNAEWINTEAVWCALWCFSWVFAHLKHQTLSVRSALVNVISPRLRKFSHWHNPGTFQSGQTPIQAQDLLALLRSLWGFPAKNCPNRGAGMKYGSNEQSSQTCF